MGTIIDKDRGSVEDEEVAHSSISFFTIVVSYSQADLFQAISSFSC